MSRGKIRSRGLLALVLGVGLAVLVAPARVALLPAGISSMPVVVFSLVTYLSLAAAGAFSFLVVDLSSAVRLRRWFVVLEGVVFASAYPLLWAFLDVLAHADGFVDQLWIALFVLPVAVPMQLVSRAARDVHLVAAAANGPGGVSAGRIRSLGTVLVLVGAVVTIAAFPVQLAREVDVAFIVYLTVLTVAVGFCLLLLGTKLKRVTDAYSARWINPRSFVGCAGVFAILASGTSFGGLVPLNAAGMVNGVLLFVAVTLLVITALTLRGYTDEWDRQWQGWTWGRKVSR